MSLHAMGDTAYLVNFQGDRGPALLAKTRAFALGLVADRLAGVTDIVPAFSSVGVFYVPEEVPATAGEPPWRVVGAWLERHLAGEAPAGAAKAKKRAPRTHVVPVCYGGEYGPDLEQVGKLRHLSTEEVVKRHAAADYVVAAVGFTPGFGYLWGLPELLATPRRGTPRLRVPAGSVGIGGEQTGVYPRETPGGWQIIGRTALEFFDPHAPEPARLAVGDRVKFAPVEKVEPRGGAKDDGGAGANAAGEVRAETETDAGAAAATEPAHGYVEILKPGTLTTVQDLGRAGQAALGVGRGGALDPYTAAVANLAVGNPVGAPLLECTYVGPVLRFSARVRVALLGADPGGGRLGKPFVVEAGEVLDCASLAAGARLYVAVAGGLRVTAVLGGHGTAVGARFGGWEGRALVAGDRVPFGSAPAPAGEETVRADASWRLLSPIKPPGRRERVEVRLVPGPDWAKLFRKAGPAEAVRAVETRRFTLSARSDRMGLRLATETPFVLPGGGGDGWSRPVVPGTVQVPPDGQPIVLMAEGQTIGGYLQLGQVASVDLARLAQARPGAEIGFRVVDLAAAQEARLRVAGDLARLRVGLGLRGVFL